VSAGLATLTGSPRLPDFRQSEAADCGLTCLAMIARFHGRPIDPNSLRRAYPVSLKGMTLKALIDNAGQLGLAGRPLRLELGQLRQLRLPAILHWDMCHFVVLAAHGRGHVTVHDPAGGVRRLHLDEVSRHFTGVALELAPQSGFTPPAPAPQFSLRDAVGPVRGMSSALAQMLILSVILQCYAMASPLLMQLVVDEAIAKSDADLVSVLAAGFGLFLAINAGASLLRARLLAYVNAALAFQMGVRLFHHLLSLPMGFFEKRHVGDLVSRFGSIDPIRRLLAEGLITAVIDGVMAVLTATTIFLIAPWLACVGVGIFLIYLLMRVAFYHMLRRRTLDLVAARARETSTFLETMRAIQSIRIFGRETERGAIWQNRYAELVRADSAVSTLRTCFTAMNDALFGAENILVIALGAHAVLAGRMSVGMLFAFVAYKQQFIAKASRLVEQAIEFRMLDLHLDRLADIAHATPEPAAPRNGFCERPIEGRLEVRNLSFRYAESEKFIFEDLSFSIGAGEYVAITGPSGGGKTTLLKVILGLLPAKSGDILIDGRKLASIGAAHFRASVGVVMQDDQLILRRAGRSGTDGALRATRLLARRHSGDADGIRQPDRRHGHLPFRRAAPARSAGARAVSAAAHAVHRRRHIEPRPDHRAARERSDRLPRPDALRDRPPPGDNPFRDAYSSGRSRGRQGSRVARIAQARCGLH
jgi:ATP-binding cassette subfamily B protein RaxB